jgi:Beta-lactamase
MNKMFTAVAVLQLIEQKKLSLDGTVGDYWRDYPNRDVATKVTIRHLLTHTLARDIVTPEFNEHRLQIQTLNDCRFHGLLWKRASHNHNHRKGPYWERYYLSEPPR